MTLYEGRPVIDIALRGDLFITAGEGTRILRVHRDTLRNASPVFHAMLSDRFKEGNDENSVSSPLVLPDDDQQAFLNFCLVLHNKWKEIDKDAHLLKLALLCDKYCCGEPFHPYFSYKLSKCHLSDVSAFDQLMIAYAIEEERMFWHASTRVIASAASCNNSWNSTVALGIVAVSKYYRRQARLEALAIAQKPINALLKARNSDRCCKNGTLIAKYHDLLMKHDIMPAERLDQDLPLVEGRPVLLTISHELKYNMPDMKCAQRTKPCSDLFQDLIRSAAVKVEKGIAGGYGLCFHCVKSGKPFDVVKSCAEHPLVLS